MFFHMAWRNLWRNTKRTLVLLAAILIGVWSLIFFTAFMMGMLDSMMNNAINTLTGHIQVHAQGFRDDPVIENVMPNAEPVEAVLERELPAGSHWTKRIRVDGVVNTARNTAGVTIVGIDPEREAGVSFFKPDALMAGEMFAADDPYAIIVGHALAEDFETDVGKKMVLMAQDADGEIASRAFRIHGVFVAELDATEKGFVFVSVPAAREMLGLENAISEFAILLPDIEQSESVAANISQALQRQDPSTNYEVHTWKELLPLISAYLGNVDTYMYLWYLVVFIAMGFGIVNTILMAVLERIREFGLLKALGMKPWWIVRLVLAEALLLLVIGMAGGNILGFASVAALAETGIDFSAFARGSEYFGMSRVVYPVVTINSVVSANLLVFVLGALVSVYPAVKAARFTPVEALTHT
ncbi:ABC transporter permease [Oceanidesulfovibrio indonesiensis]|uniref:ABC transporter permease n=1 Tax=Oceanidesulfovibrio indonesiensis TaxID=54767 RepID=A0A7M3MHT9_9BACT|nr:ABC transporter permease [Oceanidesulfovibrio indonesiensis]TVM19179.1 ABC transporter permease [Oceanidesulfovibrio indonesiensis]